MAFTLHRVHSADTSDITRIFQAAFANDHIMRHFYPCTPESVKWDQDFCFYRSLIQECAMYAGRMTKVVEVSSGKTVAFSKWDYPHFLTPEQWAEQKKKVARDRQKKIVEGSNKELMKEFFAQLLAGRDKWLVPGETFFLHLLAVDPAFQRRGIGNMLIRAGLEDADRLGAKAYVEASPDGLPLYLKFGWRIVDEMVLELERFGVSNGGTEVMPFLMREPGGVVT